MQAPGMAMPPARGKLISPLVNKELISSDVEVMTYIKTYMEKKMSAYHENSHVIKVQRNVSITLITLGKYNTENKYS